MFPNLAAKVRMKTKGFVFPFTDKKITKNDIVERGLIKLGVDPVQMQGFLSDRKERKRTESKILKK